MTSVRFPVRELHAAGSFLGGLGGFLRRPLAPREAHARLARQLAEREHGFLKVLQGAVFGHPTSPYRSLFQWAGISSDDVAAMLPEVGIEGTLERLHDAGVYVTLEEFKGSRPVQRPGLELQARATDFDNPMSSRRQFAARTGGSRAARRTMIGLDLLDQECAYHVLFYSASRAGGRSAAMWLPAAPGAVGIKNALIMARLGNPVERWFSQNRPAGAPLRYRAFAKAARSTARAWGSRIPAPEFTPAREAGRVAGWLAEHCASGFPAMLLTTPSSAVRSCAAATNLELDVAGSFFVLVGEPYTPAKDSIISGAGCSAACHYAMVEAGMIGLACHAPSALDDVHLVSDKIATIQRERLLIGSGVAIPALFHTALLPSAAKVMLNVESGDYGVREERDCGCGVLPPPFRSHLHTIRSYEKLTSEGMHFIGGDLLHLLEHVLPVRFGGHPTDFQLVEREEHGLPKVDLVVNPSIGELDPAEVASTVLDFLRHRGVGQTLMAEVWANGETLQVVRGEPHMTPAGKIHTLQRLGD